MGRHTQRGMGMGARYTLTLHTIQQTLAAHNNKAQRRRYGYGHRAGQAYWSMLHKITKQMLLKVNQLLTNRAMNDKFNKIY